MSINWEWMALVPPRSSRIFQPGLAGPAVLFLLGGCALGLLEGFLVFSKSWNNWCLKLIPESLVCAVWAGSFPGALSSHPPRFWSILSPGLRPSSSRSQQEFLLQGATRDSASDRVAVRPGAAFAGFSPRVQCPYVLEYLQQKNRQAGQSLGPARCRPRQGFLV